MKRGHLFPVSLLEATRTFQDPADFVSFLISKHFIIYIRMHNPISGKGHKTTHHNWLGPVALKFECALGSAEGLVETQVPGLHAQSFQFSRSGVRSENLNFL